MSDTIVGRRREIKLLEEALFSKKAEFIAIHGRRRIGKTYLIKTFIKKQDVVSFHVTGMKDASFKKQIRHVMDEIGNTFYDGAILEIKKDWDEVFKFLTESMQKIKNKNKPIVLFFDEFPWMATRKSLLLQTLDHYWNHVWSNDKRIKMIICGSSSSWIVNKIVNNRGGLHNRITRNMRLEPFDLKETKAYLASFGVHLSQPQIVQIYMVTGGVPYYLSRVQKGHSASQIIGNLAFAPDGPLLHEFDNLYSSLFEDSERYIDLIRIISKSRYGVSQSDLIKKSKYFSKGGRIIEKLQELEQTGFIISFIPYQHTKRGTYYRLIDEYTLFYFYWIEGIRHKLKKGDLNASYWEAIQKSPSWASWAGYAFEAICFKHLACIRSALGISADAIVDSWRCAPQGGTTAEGAQIDLLFDRNDDCITLCEIKYTRAPLVVDKKITEALSRKARLFQEMTRTKKHLFWSFISASGVKKTKNIDKAIASMVTMDDFFV